MIMYLQQKYLTWKNSFWVIELDILLHRSRLDNRVFHHICRPVVCTLVDVNSIHGLLKFDLGWDGDNETGHARMIHYLERISAKINDIFGSNKAIWISGIDFFVDYDNPSQIFCNASIWKNITYSITSKEFLVWHWRFFCHWYNASNGVFYDTRYYDKCLDVCLRKTHMGF